MTISIYTHNPKGRDMFFTIRSKNYLIVEIPINGSNRVVDYHVGRLRKGEDYRFNKEHKRSKVKRIGSGKEQENIRKVIRDSFYTDPKNRRKKREINKN